jgi:hypothetical protein
MDPSVLIPGVKFDERCFLVLEVDRDALPGAVITISNVLKQAVERTAFALPTYPLLGTEP